MENWRSDIAEITLIDSLICNFHKVFFSCFYFNEITRVLTLIRDGGGIAYLSDPDIYAGWRLYSW